jgi:hypothetical protein
MSDYTEIKVIQQGDPINADWINDQLGDGWVVISVGWKRVLSCDDVEFTDYPTYILGRKEEAE